MPSSESLGVYLGTGQSVYWGPGCLSDIHLALTRGGYSRVLIITGTSVGHSDSLVCLRQRVDGVADHQHWAGARQHCPASVLAEGMRVVDLFRPDCIVSLGGGSAIDLACALTSETAQERALGELAPTEWRPTTSLPVFAVPTTYSQAEFTDIVGITRDDGTKVVIRDQSLLPDSVLLDGRLLKQTPRDLLTTSAFKALDSCIAGFVEDTAGFFGRPLLLEAIRRLLTLTPQLSDPGVDETVLQGVQLATWMGAFPRFHGPAYPTPPNRPVWLGSAARHQLGGRSHAPHGALSAVLLPALIMFHRSDAHTELSDLAELTGHSSIEDFTASLRALRQALDLPDSLGALGVTREHILAAQDAIIAEQSGLAARADEALNLLLQLV